MTKMKIRYQRAEQFLPWNLEAKIKNVLLQPHWLDENRFLFKHDLQKGYEFILVDCESLTQTLAFDHKRLAFVLTELLGQTISSQQLPIETFKYYTKNQLLLVIDSHVSKNKQVIFSLEDYSCILKTIKSPAKTDDNLPSVISPDRGQEVVCHGFDLFLREISTGVETALTQDGERHYGYGNYSEHYSFGCYENNPLPPSVLWSPDGRHLLIQRIDERQVEELSVMQSVPDKGCFRPAVNSYKMALPGDSHVGLASLCVLDLKTRDITYIDRPPMPASMLGFIESDSVVWGANNTVYFIEWTRDRQTVRFVEFNLASRKSRVLLEETDQGFMGPALFTLTEQHIFKVLPESNEFIWYSRRSGWGHLYRYNLTTGELKNSITSGDYVVTKIHQVTPMIGYLYFTACGREPEQNPYYEHLYRVNLDGSDLVHLTPEACHHDIVPSNVDLETNFASNVHSISPSGSVFVDTFSRVDKPSKSVLRSAVDGTELMTLAQCDHTSLPNMVMPSSFKVKATDGITDLWGVMYRPSDFDDNNCYPVILMLYGTPQLCITQKRFTDNSLMVNMGYRQCLAELGFVVITLEPRGTPLRSKAFHDVAYGNLQNGGGIDDQVAAIKQLGERYAWMDLDRVGITGFSGGGFASARAMLTHPDFFKVAVASAGNLDLRLYNAGWVEALQGLMVGNNYEEQACVSLASNLQGKLLLTAGDCDANVHLAHTLQFVNELIKNNRNFDLLIFPNRQHLYYKDPYFIRRLMDYFVEHLLKKTPPREYSIKPPLN